MILYSFIFELLKGLFIMKVIKSLFICLSLFSSIGFSQIVQIGSGSYTTTFPGTDEAGRNGYPSGVPQVIGPAAIKPPPTNDWWSSIIKNNHSSNIFNYPMALKTIDAGLVLSYIPWGVYDDQEPIIVGVEGLNADKANVYDFSDWTVTMEWSNNNHSFKATSGMGMPFVYFTKQNNDIAEIKINLGQVTIIDEIILVQDARNNADFIIFAPEGSNWNQSGSTYTSDLNGENYWSIAMIPQSEDNLNQVYLDYKKYAYVFPENTSANWFYDENTSTLTTEYLIDVEVKEGEFSDILQGLLPHQWSNLTSNSPVPQEVSYSSVRGELKMLKGNYFSTENIFKGILPTLPYLANYSNGFNPSELGNKISQIKNDQLATWTDSYNEGQVMNRLIQTARIAHESGDLEARDLMALTVKNRLENWLTANTSEVAFLFYYNNTWSTLIGYPAGHGQDSNINDHHFHWGYFIHAASFVEQYFPGWASNWGQMVNELIRDAASPNREDEKYPYLRSFSPYAGHSWANGFATFPQGNDQESSSESMQFNSSLIHWGTITGDVEIRDLGIYLYTTEQVSTEEYWFDIYNRNFSSSQQYSLVSRVWGNAYDNGTFWTNDIAASYGIEMYPIHGGSLYLGHNISYVETLWDEIISNTGILNNEVNPNLWHDVYWKYLSFIDPESAISLYNSNPQREIKFGVSDAHTYYWIHGMNALGRLRSDIYSNYPISASFERDGEMTYVAHNYSDEILLVTFSDGFQLSVPPKQLATNRGSDITGVISSDFTQAYVNGSINLSIYSDNQNINRVEYYDGINIIGESNTFPYEFRALNLSPGMHDMYAKLFSGTEFGISNIINIQVGEQFAFQENSNTIPGMIEAGKYDNFEGGIGQGVSYLDLSQANYGGYRQEEYVDCEYSAGEGATIGWIAAGEWTEYSIDVEEAGFYNLSIRCASGNGNGGGPFKIEIDGISVTPDISVNSTGDWYNWYSINIDNVPINQGKHILRLVMLNGEFNIGKMDFTYDSPLDYSPPVANAGENIVVVLPDETALLNGSLTFDDDTEELTYSWEQVYGPSVINFSDQNSVTTLISDLIEGVYKIKLNVNDGVYSSNDDVLVFVSTTSNLAPTIVVDSPISNSSFYSGSIISLSANANDLDGSISFVEFFDSDIKLYEDETSPYQYSWEGATLGTHFITAHATDNEGLTTVSSTIEIEIIEAPSCFGGPENGHYTYEFSDDSNNPTITFIPSAGHVGSPTCILYYSSGGTPPGYNVTPNVPFQINANEGDQIQFYYTYSYNGLEQNTSQNSHSYIIGSCNSLSTEKEKLNIPESFSMEAYPNPFNPLINIQYSLEKESFVNLSIYDLRGRMIKQIINESKPAGFWSTQWNSKNENGNTVSAGIYLCSIQAGDILETRKIILVK
jgi:endo-1,3(4)-beta-glucanase